MQLIGCVGKVGLGEDAVASFLCDKVQIGVEHAIEIITRLIDVINGESVCVV